VVWKSLGLGYVGSIVPTANGSVGQTADITGHGVIRAYGAFAESGLTTVAPASGSTLTIADYASPTYVNTGTLASLTIVMPANPVHGQVQTIMFNGAATALQVNPNAGQTLAGMPTSAAARSAIAFIFNSTGSIWLPHNTAAAAAGTGPFLPTPGGTMTGPIALAADPVVPLHASTKQYVDTRTTTGGYLPTSKTGLNPGALWNNGGVVCVA
jgi:hypothetical protein